MSYARIADHRSMALDLQRNRAYYRALKSSVTPETVVLDLGSGIGVHGLLAAQLGAKRVYCVEPEDIIQVAEQIAGANGLAERMEFLHGRIEEVTLPETVDLIVSVFTGNMLLTEDLLPSLFYARDRYLKPDGRLLPGRARLEAVPVSTPEIYNREIASWSRPHLGLDLSVARPFAAHTAYYRLKDTRQAEYLAEPQTLLTLDFATARDIHCDQSVKFTINRTGECHGFMGWFAMELGTDWLSTAPHQPEMHWTPVFMPIDPPLVCVNGEKIEFRLVRPAYTDWNWMVTAAREERRHSTFFSRPWDPASLRKTNPTYKPRLNRTGQMIRWLLTQLEGQTSIEEAAGQLQAAFPEALPSHDDAVAFVHKYADWYD